MLFKHKRYLKIEKIAINKMEFIYPNTLSREFQRAEKPCSEPCSLKENLEEFLSSLFPVIIYVNRIWLWKVPTHKPVYSYSIQDCYPEN